MSFERDIKPRERDRDREKERELNIDAYETEVGQYEYSTLYVHVYMTQCIQAVTAFMGKYHNYISRHIK